MQRNPSSKLVDKEYWCMLQMRALHLLHDQTQEEDMAGELRLSA